MEVNKDNEETSSQSKSNELYDTHLKLQLKLFYKKLKLIVNKKAINVKGQSKLIEFKKQIIDLIKNEFKDKYALFFGAGEEIDLQLFIEYLCQLFESIMKKMVEGYNIFEKIDKNQLLLISKTKNQILSFLLSFYDFYENELIINNEEIVAQIINKKNDLEDSFLLSLIKTVNLLNIPYITKNEFINIFKEDKDISNGKILLYTKDLG